MHHETALTKPHHRQEYVNRYGNTVAVVYQPEKDGPHEIVGFASFAGKEWGGEGKGVRREDWENCYMLACDGGAEKGIHTVEDAMAKAWDQSRLDEYHRQIEVRAYYLWQNAGCPEGTALADWLMAERDVRS